MSFAIEVKQEITQMEWHQKSFKALLCAIVQHCGSLSFSKQGMTLLMTTENSMIARFTTKIIKEVYGVEIALFVKRKMNLKKNHIYGIRILDRSLAILEDLGLYSSRGLLDRPIKKQIQSKDQIRAFLCGSFLASGSINSPEKANYHLEMSCNTQQQANFLMEFLEPYMIHAKMTKRRNKFVVYVKSAEKIADFLRLIGCHQSLMYFEGFRIERDYVNNLVRTMNIDIANEVKIQSAANQQLQDIAYLEEKQMIRHLDERLQQVVELRKKYPEASLNELCSLYEEQYGTTVSKSGMKHRLNKIHALCEERMKQDETESR